MPHFYVDPRNIQNNAFTVDKEQIHYLVNVRRFEVGNEINIFDGLGHSFVAIIEEITKTYIQGKILSTKSFKLSKIKVSLYTAIPKGERFDWLIEKSSEIGIHKLIPTIYSRSVICDISGNKIERYKKISMSASSQCWRADIMAIEQPLKFSKVLDCLSKQKNTINILPWECEEKNSISKILENKTDIENINIFIGPEGGFESSEIEEALKNNFTTITLGKNILRIETAAIVASTIVLSNIEL